MAVITSTDRPNRCVIEDFGGVLYCQFVVELSVGIRVYVIGLCQILFFSSLKGKKG